MRETEIKISPARSTSFHLAEIWENKELLYFFAWRDIKVKYKQTYLGVLWVILQPLLLMGLFYFIFSKKLDVSVGMSYPVYVFAGLVVWGLFSTGITHSSESLLSSSQIIRKIYFPRILIPLASILTAVIDFFIAFTLLVILIFVFGQSLSWQAIFYFPLAIALVVISSFGIGVLLAALNVRYRDFRYLLPFTMQMLFFSSQVVYSLQSLEQGLLRKLLFLNPLNGGLELFYYPFKGGQLDVTGIMISTAVAIAFLIAGLFYFKRTEAYFADLI